MASTDQTVRVFISSTFRDMQEEREELVKQTFPQLRRLCENRGVTWREVDLRWGVPDEAKAEGKVLPLCLTEIEQALHIWWFGIGILLPQTRQGRQHARICITPSLRWHLQRHTSASVCPQAKDVNASRIRCNIGRLQ